HPSANRIAAQISPSRAELKRATRRPSRCCDKVAKWCRLTAQADFIPSSWFNTTSEGTPRIVAVIGAAAGNSREQPDGNITGEHHDGTLLIRSCKSIEANIPALYSSGHTVSAPHCLASS